MKSIQVLLSLTLAAALHAEPAAQENPFDPALVQWDPGTIQIWNEPKDGHAGFWTIQLDHRAITQADIPSLSPLEVQQAVEVLTERKYPIEFILDHLEQFRALITVNPRG